MSPKSKKVLKKSVQKTFYKISGNLKENGIISNFKVRRGLVYTQMAKDIINSYRKHHLFKAILEISKKIESIKTANPILNIKNKDYVLTAKRIDTLNNSFNCRKIFDIKFLNNKRKHFFIKESNFSDSVLEHLAVNYLKAFGLDVIKPVFSYTSKLHNYMVYEYSNLPTLDSLKESIDSKKYKVLTDKISNISKELSTKDYSNLKKEILSEFPFIINFRIQDINPRNVFYDVKENKLYLFDPFLYLKIDKSKLPNKKYISNY